jgi:hypothetical protein
VSFAGAQLALVASSRRVLAPVTLLIFAIVGIYLYRPNPVQGSFEVTAVLTAFFCAWLVASVEREVTPAAGAILTVLAGGAAAAWRGRLLLVAFFTVVITVFCLVWPTATGAFDRPPGAGDLLSAALAHLACGLAGGTLALVLGPPLRTATAFAIILAVLIASVAAARPLEIVAGPGGVARALANTPDDQVSGTLVTACAIAAVEAALLGYAARMQARWRG